jgi:hypothetical protein
MDFYQLRKLMFDYRHHMHTSDAEMLNWSYIKLVSEIDLLNKHIEAENKRTEKEKDSASQTANPSAMMASATQSMKSTMNNVKLPKK